MPDPSSIELQGLDEPMEAQSNDFWLNLDSDICKVSILEFYIGALEQRVSFNLRYPTLSSYFFLSSKDILCMYFGPQPWITWAAALHELTL